MGLSGGFQLDRDAGRYRLDQFGRGFPGPGERDPPRRRRCVQSRPHLQRGRHVQEVDQPAEVLYHGGHRIGLHRVPEVDGVRQRRTQQLHPGGQQVPVVSEERRAADALGQPFDLDSAHAQRPLMGGERRHGAVGHSVNSLRSRFRSNLPLGDFGICERTTTRWGTM